MVTTAAVGLRLLPIAAAHSSQLYLSGSLSVLALGGLAVSYLAIAALVTGRGWVIATAAVLLGAVGAFAGAMLNVVVGISLAYMLPFAVAMVLLAVWIWRATAGEKGAARAPATATPPDTAASPLPAN